ncbi:MAG TPA: FHA domain-containing protein [Tepidiformaceae bacterium]|nr:FHA domain-containing protein [Tepidiformaceae bacterium]
MNAGPTELLLLRLGLLGIMFAFVAIVALTLRGGLSAARKPATDRPGRREWRLVVVSPGDSGLKRGAEFPLAGTMLLGRDARAGIVVPAASVSTRHASIERVSGGWRITDLGSTNGTLVNGRAVHPDGALLRGGERVTVGGVELQLASD